MSGETSGKPLPVPAGVFFNIVTGRVEGQDGVDWKEPEIRLMVLVSFSFCLFLGHRSCYSQRWHPPLHSPLYPLPLNLRLGSTPASFNVFSHGIARSSTLVADCNGGSTTSSSRPALSASVPRFRRSSFNGLLITKPTLVNAPWK